MKRVDLIDYNNGDIVLLQSFKTDFLAKRLTNLLKDTVTAQIDPDDVAEEGFDIVTVDPEMVDLFDRRRGIVTIRAIAYDDNVDNQEETLDNESDIEYLNRMSNELDLPLEFRERLNGVLQGYYAAYN